MTFRFRVSLPQVVPSPPPSAPHHPPSILQLKSLLAKLQIQCHLQERRIKTLEAQAQPDGHIKTLEDENIKLRNEKAQFLQAREDEIKELTKEAGKRVLEFETKQREITEKCAKMEQHILALQNEKSQIMQQRMNEIKELGEKERRCREHEDNRARTQIEIHKAQISQQHKNEIQELTKKYEINAKETRKQLEQQIVKLQNEKSQLIRQHENEIQELTKKFENKDKEAREQCTIINAQVADIMKEDTQLKERNKALEFEKTNMYSEITALRHRIANFDVHLNDQIQRAVQAERAMLISSYNTQLEQKTMEQRKLADLNHQGALKIQELTAQVEPLRQEVVALKHHLVNQGILMFPPSPPPPLPQQHQPIESLSVGNQDMQRELERVRSQLNRAQQENEMIQKYVDQQQQTINKLKQQVYNENVQGRHSNDIRKR